MSPKRRPETAAIAATGMTDSSVASEMDHSDKECELASRSAEDGVEYPHRQELISNSGDSLERSNLSITNESNVSEDDLFQTPGGCEPTRTRRIQRTKGQTLRSLSTLNMTSDDSSDSDYLSRSQRISAYFKNPSGKWCKKRKKQRKKKKLAKRKESQTTTKRKPMSSISLEERRRRLRDPGIQFPCTPSKYLPFKLYFTYEQLVLGGFLNQVKNLKCERTLTKVLKDVKMDEDSETEDFQTRQYSYLDEDGPISPICEPEGDLNEDEAEEEVEVVEMSDFILSCQVPSKESWQLKKGGEKKSHEKT